MSSSRFTWPLAAIVAVAGCRTPAPAPSPEPRPAAAEPELAPPADPDRPPQVVARVPARSALKEIARLEDQRTLGPKDELLGFAGDEDPAVRARAATALGRLRFPIGGQAATGKLLGLLTDPSTEVRAAAAFALGMREDPSACGTLLEHMKSEDSPLVRARAIEAASKLDPSARLSEYLRALEDPAPEVRLEAACGMARWKADAPNAGEVNARLAAFAKEEADLRARAYALFALERRKAAEGRDAYFANLGGHDSASCLGNPWTGDDPCMCLFAVRGLANLAGDGAVDAALITATRSLDWRVSVEALKGLSKSSWISSLETVAAAIESADHHVRAAALEAATAQFAAFETAGLVSKTQGLGSFDRISSDPSPAVRAALVPNLLRHSTLPASEALSRDPSPHVRAAFVRGLAKHDPQAFWDLVSSVPLAKPGEKSLLLQDWAPPWAEDESLLVRGALIEALGEVHSPEADARLAACFADQDNGLRLAAVLTLLERESPVVEAQALIDCFNSSQGEIGGEVRFNLLRLATKVGGPGVVPLLARAMADPDPFVRRVALEEWARLSPQRPLPESEPAPLPSAKLAFPGEGELANPRPRVAIVTSRGTLEFVLFGDEAPQHVRNFLAHADFYAGTSFHRVVSDFVVQGGDVRGDGNGGASWRGDSLRHEIGPRKFIRGSLGMPRNEDWDSGGSQIFVTHRPTPHLDGRYTIFGELVAGFEVLDRIDLGDTIVEVRVLP